jgi:hypothetical protein
VADKPKTFYVLVREVVDANPGLTAPQVREEVNRLADPRRGVCSPGTALSNLSRMQMRGDIIRTRDGKYYPGQHE